jgi:hypothetical protein
LIIPQFPPLNSTGIAVRWVHQVVRLTEAYPIFEGDLIVAVRRVRTDPAGAARVEETALTEPCGAPWRCLEEC